MEFVEHSVAWAKGEIFEMGVAGIFGLSLLSMSIFICYFASTAGAKSLVIPFAIVGGILITACIVGGINNSKRISQYRTAYAEAPQKFIEAEKARTDNFIKWYPYTFSFAAAAMLIGIGLFIGIGNDTARAVAIGLFTLALAAFIIDTTSEANAKRYQIAIGEALSNNHQTK